MSNVPPPPSSSMLSSSTPDSLESALTSLIPHFLSHFHPTTAPRVLPQPPLSAPASLPSSLPTDASSLSSNLTNLLSLLPLHPSASTSPHFYGFITGGVTPAALLADLITPLIDANVQVHLPAESLSTEIENRAFEMLLQLLDLPTEEFRGRAMTTGATGGNIIGLACAREGIVSRVSVKEGGADVSIGEMGLIEGFAAAGMGGLQLLTAGSHSSVAKAASVVGLGRAAIRDLGKPERMWEFDLTRLEEDLESARRRKVGSIVVVGMGEVNSGRLPAKDEVRKVKALVDAQEGWAWLHIDTAFGGFVRILKDVEEEAWRDVAGWGDGLDLADSIAGDNHKLLNVPYDSGFFFTRDTKFLTRTFANIAPYLTSAPPPPGGVSIESPLNTHLENSRRFRALPVYATLTTYGLSGYRDLMQRLILHARGIARFVYRHPAYDLLPLDGGDEETEEGAVGKVYMIVMFRAKDERLNKVLKERINATGRMYVSGTKWDGRSAVRCAVSNWRVRAERDGEGGWAVVEEVLEEVSKTCLKGIEL